MNPSEGCRKSTAKLPRLELSRPDRTGEELIGRIAEAWPPEQWHGVHVALAVSGGCDSMALLRLILQLKQQHGGSGRLFVLHVNHQLRGDQSEADAAWLQQQCATLDVELDLLSGCPTDLAEQHGDGIEAAARQLRYQLLTEAAQRRGARYLATGHTWDDQVETVLFRLLRGSGLRGMGGIPPARPLSESCTLVRPLLDCRREELAVFLKCIEQSFRHDSTNDDVRLTRNRLRHEMLPLMREHFQHDVGEALVHLSQQARAAQALIDPLAERLLGDCLVESPSDVADSAGSQQLVLETGPLAQQEPYLVCEMVRLAWRQAGLPQQAMTYPWWQKLAQLAQQSTSSEVLNLPGNIRAELLDQRLVLRWSHDRSGFLSVEC